MNTPESSTQDVPWNRVRDAITTRWPQISQADLSACENDRDELIKWVKQRVDAPEDEIESVVGEFAPQRSMIRRVADTAGNELREAAESAQFAAMRVDECIANRPTESVLTSFVAGILLGATVTALWMRSTPEPTLCNRIGRRGWK